MNADQLMQGGSLILAFLAVWWLAPRRAPYPRQDMLALLGVSAMGGAVGGRLVWWIAALMRGEVSTLMALVSLPGDGGFSSLGVLVGAALAGMMATILGGYRARVWEILDFFAPIFLLCLAMARLGCLMHGCDFGVEVGAEHAPWTVRYEDPSSFAWQWFASRRGLEVDGATPPLLSLPLLLSLGTLTLLGAVELLRWRRGASWRAGTHALMLVAGYLALRFLLEGWRHVASQTLIADSTFSVSRVILLVILVILAGLVWWRRTRGASVMDEKIRP